MFTESSTAAQVAIPILAEIGLVIVLLLVAKAWQSMAPTAVQVTAPQQPGAEGLSVDGDNATVEEEGEEDEDNQRLPDLRRSELVLVRCRDGRMFKGYTLDFVPGKDSMHVTDPDGEELVQVAVR